ncbi:MAG: NAD-dependent epimerase/dehydratase family protein [Jiangellaceae bacterium]
MQVFVAGGSGVIGHRLVRKLVDAGHQVTATTTSLDKVPILAGMGADAVVMDGLEPTWWESVLSPPRQMWSCTR